VPITHSSVAVSGETLWANAWNADHKITDVIPTSVNVYDLGSTSYEFRNAYLGGTLFLGTNSDVNLYRSGTDILKTDDLLILGDGTNKDLLVFNTERSWRFTTKDTGASTKLILKTDVNAKAFQICRNDDESILSIYANTLDPEVTVNGSLIVNDQLQLPVQGSSGGILIGGDVQLYRYGANVLRTPDQIDVETKIWCGGPVDAERLWIGGTEIIDSSRILKNIASIAQSLLPDADNTRDLGSSSYRWRDLRLSGDAYIGGDALISGVLDNPYINAYSSDYGLVLYLPFEEGTGTSVYDESPHGNDGTVYGTLSGTVYGASWVDGKYDKALGFDGDNDYVELSEPLTIFDKSFTVSMWVWADSTISGRWGILLGDYNLGGIDVNFEIVENGKIRFYWAGNPDLRGTKTLETEKWYLITFVRDKDAETVKGYVNDELDINYSGAISDKTATVPHRIGRDARTGDTAFGPGIIDDVRIYNRALTEEEIQQLYQGKDIGGGRVLCLRFDEGEGTTVYSDNWCDGKYGKALSFDGEDDFALIDDSPSLHIADGTIIFWVNKLANHEVTADFLNKNRGGRHEGDLHIGLRADENIEIWLDDGVDEHYVTSGVLGGGWYHVAFTFGSGGMKLYINSELVDTNAYTGGIENNTWKISLGAGTEIGTGLCKVEGLDEVRIYNRALTLEEIRALYLAGKSRYSRSIVVSDKFRIFSTSLSELLRLTTTNLNLSVSLLPLSDSVYDIGSSSYKWKNLYITNTINFGTDTNLYRKSADLLATDDDFDFNQHQAKQFVIENRTSDPSSPVEGQLWIRTDL